MNCKSMGLIYICFNKELVLKLPLNTKQDSKSTF